MPLICPLLNQHVCCVYVSRILSTKLNITLTRKDRKFEHILINMCTRTGNFGTYLPVYSMPVNIILILDPVLGNIRVSEGFKGSYVM